MSDGVAPSKGAWTPGPWKVMSPDYVAGVPVYFLDDINFCTVSRVDGTNAIANATLISKAPQMADLLNAELDSLDDWLRDESISDEIKGEMLLREDEIQKLLKQIGAERLLSELEVKP